MEGLSCARVQMIHQRCKKRKTDCIRADSHFCGNTCIIRCRIGVPFIVTQCAAAYGTVIALRQKRVIFRHVKKKKELHSWNIIFPPLLSRSGATMFKCPENVQMCRSSLPGLWGWAETCARTAGFISGSLLMPVHVQEYHTRAQIGLPPV